MAKHAAPPTLQEVARKRGWQALVQSLVIDVVFAVAMLIATSLDQITTMEGLGALGVMLVKTIFIAAAQWFIRRYRDRAGYDEDGNPV